VVYESMYGNTHVISTNIADALRPTHEVTLVPVVAATRELLDEADLLVVGGPTHMHRPSTASSRQMAAQAAASQARLYRPCQPRHPQAAQAARLPPHRRPGELPGHLAQFPARR
jgi:hypothetical protein